MKRIFSNSPAFSLALVLTCVVSPLSFAPRCAADTIYVDGDRAVGGSGDSWVDAMRTIEEAMAAAKPGDEIWVAMGVYFTALSLKSEVSLYGGFQGFESDLSERHFTTHTVELTTHTTVVNASMAGPGNRPALHAVTLRDVSKARLDGFAIVGAEANGAVGDGDKGGGIFSDDRCGSNTIANCVVTGNSATFGGGLYCNGSSALTIENCLIAGNTALEDGGGIFIDGGSSLTMTLARVTVSGNISRESGGGITCLNASPVIVNCIVSGQVSQIKINLNVNV